MVEPCGRRAEEVAEEARSIGVSLGHDGGHDSAAQKVAVQTRELGKVYGLRETAVHALRDVTLRFPSREFAAVMGPSGSGKSTLMHCLAALDLPTSGRVFLGGTEVTDLSHRQRAHLRRDRIGFVFQAFNLIPTLDAYENITLPQLLAGRPADRGWLDRIVDQVGLGDRLHHRPTELSGGQQQRVAVARALAGRPEIIFADEPTGNLDTRAGHEVLALLRTAVDFYGQTLVMVTHDPAAAAYADRVVLLNDGQVVDDFYGPTMDRVRARLKHLDELRAGGREAPAASWPGSEVAPPEQASRPASGPEDDEATFHPSACLRRTSRRLNRLRSEWRDEGGPPAAVPQPALPPAARSPAPSPESGETRVQRWLRQAGRAPEPIARSDPDDGWLPALYVDQPLPEAVAEPEPSPREAPSWRPSWRREDPPGLRDGPSWRHDERPSWERETPALGGEEPAAESAPALRAVPDPDDQDDPTIPPTSAVDSDDHTVPPPGPGTPVPPRQPAADRHVNTGNRVTADQLLERIRARATAAKPSPLHEEDEDGFLPPAVGGLGDADSSRLSRGRRRS